jgi:hypothetical protein
VTYTYTGLPTGCLSANTNLLSCTPTGAGDFSVELTVTDLVGQSVEATIAIEVTNPVAVMHSHSPTPTNSVGGVVSNAEEYLVLGAIVGAAILGVLAVTEISAQAQYRREGEALAREMLSTPEGDEDRPHP